MRVQSQFIEMFGNPLFNTKKWECYSNINTITTIVLGSTPNTKEPKYWDGDIKWITPAEMDDETFMINDTLRHITDVGVKSATLTKLPVGTVLLSTRAPIGKVGIVAAEMYCNQGFKSFICSNQINSIFLYYTLKSNKEYLCSLGTGTTFKELSKKVVEGLKLAVPPIDLQKRFATIYKQVDKSKFAGFKSQFIEMFGNHSTTPVSHYIDDSYPGEWGVEDRDGSGVKVIRTTNFTNAGKLDLTNVVTRSILEKKVKRKAIKKFDTILERSGGTAENPVGRVVLFEEDDQYLCNNFTQVLRFKDIEPRYAFYALFYYYQMNKTVVRSMGSKTTGIQNLNMNKYLEIGVPDASDEEQRLFIAIAEQADKSKYYN